VQTDGVCDEYTIGIVEGDAELPLVAAIAISWPAVTPLGTGANVIDWDAAVTENVCGTGVAANQVASPAWLAVIVQLPIPMTCTRLPAITQTPLAANVTGNPELAVADTGNASP
jgi:hypothetical protein